MSSISLTVNGENVAVSAQPRTQLADLLREGLRLTGTHVGCEHGICGACTVLVDGAPVRSCIVLAVSCDQKDVRTIEGFEDDLVMNELRDAFRREHGLQCGFCTAGMLIAARDIVLRLPGADERRIRRELSGNLCRCTGYVGIINAVRSVIESRRAKGVKAVSAAGQIVIEKGQDGVEAARPSPQHLKEHPQSALVRDRAANVTTHPPGLAASGMTSTAPRQGWTRFSESFLVHDNPEKVWKILSNFPFVAACLPGAELIEHDQTHVKGRMQVRLGPILAAFSGSANVELDPHAMRGRMRGAGSDGGSGSRTKAEATYQVVEASSGGSRVMIEVEYSIQGALAQFSRSGVAQELGRRLVAEFAANLNARIRNDAATGDRIEAVAPLDAGKLARAALRRWFPAWAARIFKRQGTR